MEALKPLGGIVVNQSLELAEVILGDSNFETKNRYNIFDEDGNQLYFAMEQKGYSMLRGSNRPFHIAVLGEDGQMVLRIKRPFTWSLFYKAHITGLKDEVLGVIQKRIALLHRKFLVLDSSGAEIFQIIGPRYRPWTFKIMSDGVEHGRITKKWSGALKEKFSDADNFGVLFPEEWDVKTKAIFLGAVFLIDFVFFEK